MCDSKGVVYLGRKEGMDQFKSAFAVDTKLRTLEEAMVGADVFLGVSAKGAVTPEMVSTMAENPSLDSSYRRAVARLARLLRGAEKTPIGAFAAGVVRVFGSRCWRSSLSIRTTNGS